VLVTGASRRIGRAIALDLAAHGWDVAVHGHAPSDDLDEAAAAVEAAGGRAAVVVADLSDEAAARALVPEAQQRLGRIDAVVNNASLFEYDDAADASYRVMDLHWRVNAGAPVVLAQALAAALADRTVDETTPPGCVVNVLDQKLWNPNPDNFSYTLSKAALREATVMLAQALAPRVRVCAVAPGVTLPSGPMTEAEFQRAHRMTPLQRSSTPDDLTHAIRYLLQARAVTGSTLLVDGGQHLAPQDRDVYFLARDPAA